MPVMISERDDLALINVIFDYLEGKSNSRIKAALDEQCERGGIACKQRYEQILARMDSTRYNNYVLSILKVLSVPEDQDKRKMYLDSPNLYVLLKKLEPKYRHLTQLIHLIDEAKPSKSWAKPFLVTALMIAGSAVLLSFKKEYVTRLSLFAKKATVHFLYGLQRTLRLVKNTPLLGLLINGVALLWAWYQAFSDGLGLDHDKASKLFLKIVENTFPIISYLLCFFAGGVMTIPALSLFIIGSAIDAVGELYTFIRHELEQRFEPIPEGDTYYLETARLRVAILRKRDVSMLLINLVATGLITASVVVWCLFPPSWIITVSCVVFGWLVGMFKLLSTAHLKHTYANRMQTELNEVTISYPLQSDGLLPQPTVESSYAVMNRQLQQEVAALKRQVTQLEQQIAAPPIEHYIHVFVTVGQHNGSVAESPVIAVTTTSYGLDNH